MLLRIFKKRLSKGHLNLISRRRRVRSRGLMKGPTLEVNPGTIGLHGIGKRRSPLFGRLFSSKRLFGWFFGGS